MKINSVDNNTNFGWRYKTHEKITAMVVDEFPDLKKYKSVLTKMVVMPDFDERGFKGNNHFYYTILLILLLLTFNFKNKLYFIPPIKKTIGCLL